MSSDELEIAARGGWGTVEWATDRRGRMPARDYYLGLSLTDQAKVLALMNRLAEAGTIRNEEKFKKVEGSGLFEFKSFQIRLLGDFRPGRRFLVAHGLRKKQDKLSKDDISTAERVLGDNDEVEGGR